jgi:2-polyprenyl-6-methoxyphenol hydroxylase-like FAD-dependent oxidoreductase
VGESFDVVVVGARCAGAPLAAMLARAGVRVCLIDRDRFPSDTPPTRGIQPTGVAVLERLGVLPELLTYRLKERGTAGTPATQIQPAGLRPTT